MTEAKDIAVVGAGAWGTALAQCLSSAGHALTLWGRGSVAMERLSRHRRHEALPDLHLDASVDCTSVIDFVRIADVVILATPTQTQRHLAEKLQQVLRPGVPLIVVAKGVENRTGLLLPDVIREVLPDNPVALLSGPTFATELSRGLPSAATLAAEDIALARDLGQLFADTSLRVYASDDLTGVALGGAFKNVLAIAAGAVMGARLGANARASIISRGLAELARLGRKLGARSETLGGLSGLGDIVLSCTDDQSRNYAYGFALGQGVPPPSRLAEGALTVQPLLSLAIRHGVEMPIAQAVDAVVNRGAPLGEVVQLLLNRPGRRE